MKNTLSYEVGITKMKWRQRFSVVWRLLLKKPCVFKVETTELFYRNHSQRVTEIEL